jgi:GH35 family endo-1,4-beta-xylanase
MSEEVYYELTNYIDKLSRKYPSASEDWDAAMEHIGEAHARVSMCEYDTMINELIAAAWAATDAFRVARRPIVDPEQTELFEKMYKYVGTIAEKLKTVCKCK